MYSCSFKQRKYGIKIKSSQLTQYQMHVYSRLSFQLGNRCNWSDPSWVKTLLFWVSTNKLITLRQNQTTYFIRYAHIRRHNTTWICMVGLCAVDVCTVEMCGVELCTVELCMVEL